MTTDSDATKITSSYRWVVLFVTSIAFFMSPFDATVVSVALPSMSVSLRVSVTFLIWIPTVYLLVIASLETTIGRIGDVRGMRNLFIIALSLFTIGSLIASLSGNLVELIFARIVQGLGAAGMDACGIALLVSAFPVSRRGRALGINQMTVYIGLTSGPLVGGILVQGFGWRSIFYVNIPIGITAIALALAFIKKDEIASALQSRFDILGSFCLASFLTMLFLILNGGDIGLSSVESLVLVVTCLASFLAFVYVEGRVAQSPLLDLRLFTQNRLFAGGIATSLMNYLTVYGTLFVLSVYLQTILGYTPINAGLVLLTQPIIQVIASPVAGLLSERISARVLSSFGMALKAGAFIFLSLLGTNSPAQSVFIPLIFVGLGHGFFSPPNVNSVMGSVEPEKFGVASGTLGTIRTIGNSVGIAILGGLAVSMLPPGSLNLYNSNSVISGVLAQDFASGMHLAFLAASGISLMGVFTSLMRGKKKATTKTEFASSSDRDD